MPRPNIVNNPWFSKSARILELEAERDALRTDCQGVVESMNAHAQSLQDTINLLRVELAREREEATTLRQAIGLATTICEVSDYVQARIERLEEALKRYGKHGPRCSFNAFPKAFLGERFCTECTCGLKQAQEG
jgi:hypothetical protein